MQVTMHPDEGLLDEVLSTLAIADHAVNEVDETTAIELDDLAKGALITREVPRDDLVGLEILPILR